MCHRPKRHAAILFSRIRALPSQYRPDEPIHNLTGFLVQFVIAAFNTLFFLPSATGYLPGRECISGTPIAFRAGGILARRRGMAALFGSWRAPHEKYSARRDRSPIYFSGNLQTGLLQKFPSLIQKRGGKSSTVFSENFEQF